MDEGSVIRLEGISKRYGYGDAEIFALKDVDLEVRKGEFIMIMGPSGCGKTTLLNVLGLLDGVTTGTYYLDGFPANRMSGKKKARFRAEKIGFIFQNFNLVPDMTVVENVALPLVYSGVAGARRLIRASEVLQRFQLQEREYYLPHQLSGGQQQRVAIARSLVNNPEIILADEPTGNLDSKAAHIVMEELRAIHLEGNTIIMVTHNAELTTYATRVIKMLDGAIDEDVKTVDDRDLPMGGRKAVRVRFLKTKPAESKRAIGAPVGSLQALGSAPVKVKKEEGEARVKSDEERSGVDEMKKEGVEVTGKTGEKMEEMKEGEKKIEAAEELKKVSETKVAKVKVEKKATKVVKKSGTKKSVKKVVKGRASGKKIQRSKK